MKHLHIICKATPNIFSEAVHAISDIFLGNGWRVTYDPAFEVEDQRPYSKDVNLVIKAQRKYTPDHLPEGAINILFQSEQFSKLRQFESMPYSENWDLILDVFYDNIERVNGCVPVGKIQYLPIGFHSAYQWPGRHGHPVPDNRSVYDVYFFGASTTYRRKIWKEVIEPVTKLARFARSDIGAEKYTNITHSKVNIFISGWEPYLLPMMHCMQILANQKYLLAIGEDSDQLTCPFHNLKHFDFVKPNEARSYLEMVLKNEEYRRKAASISYEDIRENHTFKKYLKEALSGVVDL